MNTQHDVKKSSVLKIQNCLVMLKNMRTVTFLILLLQNVIVVWAEDGFVGDGGSSSFKVTLFPDKHVQEDVWTDLNSHNIISTVLNKEMEDWDGEVNTIAGERMKGMDSPQEEEKTNWNRESNNIAEEQTRGIDSLQEEEKENKIQGIQNLTNIQILKKPRFLCLHGHGSSAARFEKYFEVWPESVTEKMDFVFINGPFPIEYPTPGDEHFEWFNLDLVNTEYDNFEEGIAYIEDRMIELGPFDGVLGFSEGAVITGSLPGMQQQGVCLTKVGKIEHVVIISGAKLGGVLFPLPKLAEAAYTSPINIPSLHIFGEHDIARPNAPELVEAYVDPLVIYHHGGHEVPKLDEEGLEIMFEFLKKINAIV